jgi:hypothetical protein
MQIAIKYIEKTYVTYFHKGKMEIVDTDDIPF